MHKIANYVQQIIIWHTSYAQTYLRFPPERSMTFCLTSTLWFNFIYCLQDNQQIWKAPQSSGELLCGKDYFHANYDLLPRRDAIGYER